ncbi:MAG: putative peptidoglycan glycosyltransferase FtsW [Clostridiaceae bacterium]
MAEQNKDGQSRSEMGRPIAINHLETDSLPDDRAILWKNRRKELVTENSLLNKVKQSFDFSMEDMDKTLVFLLVFLVIFGVVMVTSTASYGIIRRGQESIIGYVLRQISFALIGFITMFFMAAFDYHRLNWKLIFGFGPVVLLLNILPRLLGDQINGAYRWLQIGPINFQPSELAKYYVVILAACLLAMPLKFTKRAKFKRYLLLLGAVILFGFIIVVPQSNLSTGAIMIMASFVVIVVSNIPLLWNVVPISMGIAAGVLMVLKTGYRLERVMGFLNPFSDPTGNTLQVVQSLYALSMGGLLGRGLGNSRFKAFWLPFAENDFIFAIICEELGLIGGLTILGALGFLVFTGFKIARQAMDLYGRLLAVGIISVIGIQAAINMAVVMGAFPVTGVPLPFISAGGTSLVVNLAAMGILLNISKQKR